MSYPLSSARYIGVRAGAAPGEYLPAGMRASPSIAMPKLQRYRGVRQRHWGSWVSEIRHPLLKTRIWLGTYEMAEDAARAYDEAARLISGSAARTNFPLNNGGGGSLSPTLRAKLEKCCMLTSSPVQDEAKAAGTGADIVRRDEDAKGSGGANAGADEGEGEEYIEEYIEEMIKELTHYGSMEIVHSSACSSSVI